MKQIPASFYQSNCQKLLKQADVKAVVVAGNVNLQRSHDTNYPFRQDSNFLYLSGVSLPDCVLVFTADQSAIILPKRSQIEMVFDGEWDEREVQETSGVDAVLNFAEGEALLKSLAKKHKSIGYLSPYKNPLPGGVWTNPGRGRLVTKLKRLGAKNLVDIRRHLARMRMIKTAAEISLLDKTVGQTLAAFREVERQLPELHYEYEVEAVITSHFRKHNLAHAYSPIVASGANAATLHYVANDSPLKPDSLLLIDAGAEAHGYCADITRTFPVGKPNSRQLEVLAAVKAIQKDTFSLLKPGFSFRDLGQAVEKRTGQELQKLGLISSLEAKAIKQYFPHSVSHFLGLDVHDVGDYSASMQAGMVMTVEPGIYIPGEGIGVRLEDDVVITKSGYRILGQEHGKIS